MEDATILDPNTGKEYFLDQNKSQDIQNRINMARDMPETAKQDVSKKDVKELEKNTADGLTGFSSTDGSITNFNGEGYGVNNNTYGNFSGTNNPETRKGYYDTFNEMSQCNFIHRGLQIIADDGSQKNIEGDTVKIYSDDDDIKNILEDLFHKRLNFNKELWSIIYETCKLGDNFYEIIPDNYDHPTEIARLRYLNPYRTNRIEKNGKLAFYTYTTDINDIDIGYDKNKPNLSKDKNILQYKLQPWQVIHFKISDKDYYPYGGSLLKSGVRTFRRLNMLEDAIVIYRLARVPERRVFKIGVGNLSTTEANKYVQRIKDNYRTSQIMDESGNINRTASALSITQDIFVPVRDGDTGTEISSLAPGQGLNNIDDIKYFRDQILWTMNIPPEYLGFASENGGGGDSGRGSLAMQDIKFSRFVERIQYYIEEGLTKIAAVELFFKKKTKDDLKNFKIELTQPSNIKELMDIEMLNQRMSLISSMLQTNLFSNKYILKYVMKLSNKEIDNITLYKQLQDQNGAGQGQDMNGGLGGLGGGLDMGGGLGGAPVGAPENTAPEAAPAEMPQQLNAEKMIELFGKKVILENKADFNFILKAAKEYEKELKEKNIKEEEEKEEDISSENLMEEVKRIFSGSKHEATNKISDNLYYEGELQGLSFEKEEFSTFVKPHKRSGPKSSRKSDIISEERKVSLNKK